MKVFGVAGWSGSGKTTLVCQLIPALIARGLSVSTMKHAHHGFDVDQPGKDSYEHRAAGAREVLITSRRRWVLMHESADQPEASLEEMIARMSPVDLLLIEGFKRQANDKIEVYRPALGKPLLAAEDANIVAIASDQPGAPTLMRCALPVLDLNQPEAIADLIVGHCGLASLAKATV